MLTNFVYRIQLKNRKNSCRWPGVFSVTYQGIKSDTSRILSSLLELLYVIRINNSPQNRSMNRM